MNGKEAFLLLAAFISYLAVGGVVFMYLETGAIEGEIVLLRDKQQEIEDLVEAAKESHNLTRLDQVWALVDEIVDINKQEAINSNETSFQYRHWDFYDAFFFSLTVITTIGYGHLAPISSGGIVFCMFYALFGIPMTGILIAGFGNFFSSILLRAHERSTSSRFNATTGLVVNTVLYLIPGTIIFLFLPAVVFAHMEEWSYLVSFYYAFITLTTIGFGDYVGAVKGEFEHRWIYQVSLMAWIIFGLGYLAMMLNFISKAMKSKQMKRINKTVGRGFHKTQKMISKEMEEFIRAMNTTSTKVHNKPGKKRLKRTVSLPLVRKRSLHEVGRTHSDSELFKHPEKTEEDMYMIQQEAHTNTMGFIFSLAKAFAFEGFADDPEPDMHSLRSQSRQASLMELLGETIRQHSRRNSTLGDGDIPPLHGRLHPARRSYEISNLTTHPGLMDNTFGGDSNGIQPRRKSDFGCYLDVPRTTGMSIPPPKSITTLEEVNEVAEQTPSPTKSGNKRKSWPAPAPPPPLMVQNGGQNIPKETETSTSTVATDDDDDDDLERKDSFGEIDELLVELKELEELWSTCPENDETTSASTVPMNEGGPSPKRQSLLAPLAPVMPVTDDASDDIIPEVRVVVPGAAAAAADDVINSNADDLSSLNPLLTPDNSTTVIKPEDTNTHL